PVPGFEEDTPYAIAIVQLDEGPRMMTNIVGIENTPENLILDMKLKVVFDDVSDEIAIPKWEPA
ncbi:MAG TPA: OB-fold domain-containing protein, partial [Dehalococcoidia bacterium]|nr:OB-fold domain-containing protein [Dehalococcoidia bacterium]